MEEFSDADLEGEQVNDTDFTPEKALDLMPKTTTRWSLSTAPVRVTRYESEKETSDQQSEQFPQMAQKTDLER